MNWLHPENSALRRGADLVIQSAHKTLPALTASAWLHGAEGIDIPLLRKRLRMVQTSSPSFITMLSLDDARAWMDEHGKAAGAALEAALADFRREAAKLGYTDGQKLLPEGLRTDPRRLVLDAPQGGFRLAEQLEELGSDVELSDAAGIGCILSLMDGPERLGRLLDALRQIEKPTTECDSAKAVIPAPPAIPPRRLPLHEAAFAPTESLPIHEACGRISAGQVGLYPPGVAVLSAGEEITPEIVNWLSAMPADKLFGLDEHGRLTCVRDGG
jgi:arginine/lysine/ornithine decarboxylase